MVEFFVLIKIFDYNINNKIKKLNLLNLQFGFKY